MTQVDIQVAKMNLSRLVDQAAGGTEIVITRAGKPLVKLVPYATRKPRRASLYGRSNIKPAPRDLDAPITREALDGLRRGK